MNPSSFTAVPMLALRRGMGLIPRVLWWGCLAAAGFGAWAADPVVSNVRVLHRPGTLAVEVSFDLAVDDPAGWWAVLSVSTNQGANFVELTNRVTGKSWPVPREPAQKLIWNPPVGWLDHVAPDVRLRVTVADRGALPGMVAINPGTFLMGSAAVEVGRDGDEGPTTKVTLSRGYWLGKYEVTQREWKSVMGNNPSHFKGDPDLPVEEVSWEEAMEYCRRVTERERDAGRLPRGYEYRLPTEAEWEYACRAGTTTATAFGDRLDSRQANFNGNVPHNEASKGPHVGRTTPVGSYPPNAWGLHDMHGNVWEWCLDWYGGKLPGGAVTNPTGDKLGSYRANRGGSWFIDGSNCRSASRAEYSRSLRLNSLGFRAVCAPVLR